MHKEWQSLPPAQKAVVATIGVAALLANPLYPVVYALTYGAVVSSQEHNEKTNSDK